MAGIANEALSTGIGGVLEAATDFISEGESIEFVQYTQLTTFSDGYVFWFPTGAPVTFRGSMHVSSMLLQQEDQTATRNDLIFTSDTEITVLNNMLPQRMWIGSFGVGENAITIVFSSRDAIYKSADLWHYRGVAMYPALASQLISSPSDLPTAPIVSNSLPIWLALPGNTAPFMSDAFLIYPGYLVPANLTPPYASVFIVRTRAIGAFPIPTTIPPVPDVGPGVPSGKTLSTLAMSQLMRDDVRMTFYGLTNQQVGQYYAAMLDYSRNTDDFGFLSYPAYYDEPRVQAELTAIAMKKVLTFQVSYYLNTADAIARRLILSAAMSITEST